MTFYDTLLKHMTNKPPEERGNNNYREPGIWESLKEMLLGVPRPFDCVQVEVTSRCSGRCSYCPQTVMGDSWQGRDMKMKTFTRLWPLMRQAGRVHLQGWGEPLLNGAFFDMAALARRAGCNVSTTTCGLRMNAAVARRVVDSGMDIVAFSLAGTDAASNASRIGVDFAQVCAAVAELQRERKARNAVYLEIHFAYLLLASQVAAVRGLPALMERLGVHAAVVSTLDFIPRPELAAEAFFPVDNGKLAPVASVLAETAGEARRRGLDFHYTLPGAAASGNRCRENVLRSLFVGADGSVSPCVYLNVPAGAAPQRRVFGNLDDQDPLAIWEGQDFRRFREGLAAGKPDAACRACPKRFFS